MFGVWEALALSIYRASSDPWREKLPKIARLREPLYLQVYLYLYLHLHLCLDLYLYLIYLDLYLNLSEVSVEAERPELLGYRLSRHTLQPCGQKPEALRSL